MGGDEFTIIQPRTTGRDDAAELAREILQSLTAPFRIHAQDISIGVSVGISRYPMDGTDVDSLLQGADAAMYFAKQNHSQGFYFFDADLRRLASRRKTLEKHLRAALANGELYVIFQPVYDAVTFRLVRFEALCRWKNAELGEISPAEFIPVAEEIGAIGEIGRWVSRRILSAGDALAECGTRGNQAGRERISNPVWRAGLPGDRAGDTSENRISRASARTGIDREHAHPRPSAEHRQNAPAP